MKLFVLSALLFGALIAYAKPRAPNAAMLAALEQPVGAEVRGPEGFYDFCDRMVVECEPVAAGREMGSQADIDVVHIVNRAVNWAMESATDIEVYGRVEYWTVPQVKDWEKGALRGDCEDAALLKRHILIANGWPSSAMLMTVVVGQDGSGHAVLTARTPRGDLILDTFTDDVLLWRQTGYQFVMRQSAENPRTWEVLR